MKLRLLYFARLREVLGLHAEHLDVAEDVRNVADLLALLRGRGPVWERELAAGRAFRVAVNQDMADLDTPLRADAEVAIFPPVTGG